MKLTELNDLSSFTFIQTNCFLQIHGKGYRVDFFPNWFNYSEIIEKGLIHREKEDGAMQTNRQTVKQWNRQTDTQPDKHMGRDE